jgi:hypothetical protein
MVVWWMYVFSCCLWVVDVIKVDVMVLKVWLFLNHLYVEVISYVILKSMP